ncbi:MAG: hypothetical protein LLF93_09440 [Bacteroidales bacterium]|nr:hypothetical protein [Bacteroidales bacterium]
MKKEEFYSYIENIKFAEEFKNEREGLYIDWETDPKKMDLMQLHGVDVFKPFLESGSALIKYSVEFVKISEFQRPSEELFGRYLDRSYVELYKLIKKGVKLIPPATIRRYTSEDGEVHMPILTRPVNLCDGCHRLRLSQALNIEKIPILIIDVPDKFTFNKTKWDIECDEKNIILTHKEQIKKISLPLKDFVGMYNSSLNYAFWFQLK